MMEYLAHISSDGRKQRLKDHLCQTCHLAEEFARPLRLAHVAGIAALLHDSGKYTPTFQTYLRQAVQDQTSVKRGSVDHSTFGGKLILELAKKTGADHAEDQLAEILSNAIFSHHNSLGLKDHIAEDLTQCPYAKRVEKKLPDNEYIHVKENFFAEVISREELKAYYAKALEEYRNFEKRLAADDEAAYDDDYWTTLYLIEAFIYSCLLDADRTDTACFEEQKVTKKYDEQTLFQTYYERLLKRLQAFGSPKNKIDRLRSEMSKQCEYYAEKLGDGIYQLSIPTGGGKTLASLRYALKKAILQNKKRIIYISPYNSILDQNTQVFREVLNGDKDDETNILEYHSNIIRDKEKYETESQLDLATETFAIPIVMTTLVQFLNTVYARGTRNRRRFHNFIDTVIIIDEVQNIPLKCLALFNMLINFLTKYGKTSVLLCTATQPALEKLPVKAQLAEKSEIVQHLAQVEKEFKRVKFHDETARELGLKEMTRFIFEKAQKNASVLVILNTKAAVANVFEQLQMMLAVDIKLYHLSTGMCPAHRKEELTALKADLKAKQRVICISTQLIEAGVDISFSCVIRSLAGLDSIAQSAGRCNRNGERTLGDVYIVALRLDLENTARLRYINDGKSITKKQILGDPAIKSDAILSPQVVNRYFSALYKNVPENTLEYAFKQDQTLYECALGDENIIKFEEKTGLEFEDQFGFGAETIAKYFNVIDDVTTTLLVPYDERAKELIALLNGNWTAEFDLREVLRQAQIYTVNVYEQVLVKLAQQGAIYDLLADKHSQKQLLALNPESYDAKLGLTLKKESSFDLDNSIF